MYTLSYTDHVSHPYKTIEPGKCEVVAVFN